MVTNCDKKSYQNNFFKRKVVQCANTTHRKKNEKMLKENRKAKIVWWKMLLNINHEGEGKTENDCQKLKKKSNVSLENDFNKKLVKKS